MEKGKNAYGIMIQTNDDEYLIAGINMKVSFLPLNEMKKPVIGEVQEGGFFKGAWLPYRYLNGDETWHNSFVFARGRSYSPHKENGKVVFTKVLAPIAVLNTNLESNLLQQQVECPGIYKVKLYQLGL